MQNVPVSAAVVEVKSGSKKKRAIEPVSAKTPKKKADKIKKPKVVEEKPAPAPETIPVESKAPARRNMDRFLEATGKTEKEYYDWATEVGRRMHINKLDALVSAKLDVYTVAHLANHPTELPEGMPENEVNEYMAIHSENPYELAKLWKQAKADAKSWVSKESILNEWLTGIRREDFERWCDKNHTNDISRKWWSQEALPLDTCIKEINEMCLLMEEVTMDDATDFIRAYKPGGYVNPAWKLVKQIEERFKEVTTFRIKDYYVEHLLKMCQMAETEMQDDLPF